VTRRAKKSSQIKERVEKARCWSAANQVMGEGAIVLPGSGEVAEEMTGLRACVPGKACPSARPYGRERTRDSEFEKATRKRGRESCWVSF